MALVQDGRTMGTSIMGRTAFTLISAIAAFVLSTGSSLAEVRIGKSAPDFSAKATSGTTVTLSGLKGKTVVLEWTNDGCPYVGKHYGSGNMQALQKEATGSGVVWLSVISSAPGLQGYVNELEADHLTETRKAAPTAVLLDPEGKLGRLYDARTTPHMFVIDPAGQVAYMGAMDDKPTANRADVPTARNYVREALAAVAQGKPVSTASTRPYGCSVKYGAPRS
jgi:alkyl hydroperoxide reductase subunit AhpC